MSDVPKGRLLMMQKSTKDHLFSREVLVHREELLRAAMHLTRSAVEAEDLVQESLIKAYRAFDRLRPHSQTRPWLLKILRNTFISEWRRRRRERAVLQLGAHDISARWMRDAPQTESVATCSDRPADDLDDEVVEALNEVPHHYRTCVLLVDVHQKSYQETAELTSQPLGTVQSRLFRGRRILKGLLDDYARREGYLARAA